MSKHSHAIIAAVAVGSAIFAAWWTYRRGRSGGAIITASSLYHAANNPNGFVYLPGVGYTRTLPNGVVEFLT